MKRTIAVLPLLLLSVLLAAQAPFPTRNETAQFPVSTTCVVLEDDAFSLFNSYIRDAVQEYWTLTPFEFIDQEEFGRRRNNPDYSFIMLTETTFDKDKSGSVFSFINLVQGKNVADIGKMPEICAVPLAPAGDDGLDYGYKLGAILLFMQKHAALIVAEPSKTGRKYLSFYNENIPRMSGKTILVRQEDLSPAISDPDDIRAIYPGKVEIVTEEEMVKAIEEKSPETVVLHKVGPSGDADGGYCFKMLIGTDDAVMYYYNSHRIDGQNPDGLLPSDLKRLARFR
ncbi:MAG TPA: hypothetical protein PLM01_05405 [Bacteroidales bacterium]|nr:hypothetical protein [Bacteroidales bacterium]HQJ81928.1 hypothetical protein [Bacteroidales bacterium]